MRQLKDNVFMKVYCYPEVLFIRHVLVFFQLFETSDLKKFRILIFISTMLIPKLKYNANTNVPK